MVLQKILDLVKDVEHEYFQHEHVHTSEDAASIRGNDLSQAAKAIVLRGKKNGSRFYVQCVLQGHKKLNIKELKKFFGFKKLGLATPEQVLEVTNCTIGSVPPFGHLFGLPVFVDEDLFTEKYIFFSAGTHNDSVKMKSQDYKEIVPCHVMKIS